jgi:diacylglycerol kinase
MQILKPDFRRGFVFDLRLWALLIPAMVILSTDIPVLLTLLYSMSAILVVVAMAHSIRRVLFHYIDLGELARKASETPGGAALIFLGVCILIAFIVLSTALWISR